MRVMKLDHHFLLKGFALIFSILVFTITSLAWASGDFDENSAIVASTTTGERVIMGGKGIIQKEEAIRKLVVIGGAAEVYGSVGELVVVGGSLYLREGAVVTDDLVIVGGLIEKDEGVEILGKEVDISMPISEDGWKELSRNLKERYLDGYLEENRWVKYLGSFVKILFLLVFAVIGRVLTPGLMNRTYTYLRNNLIWSAIMGLITVLLVLPVTLFLTLSLVVIPLLPLQFSLLILFVIYGEIHMAQWLASFVFKDDNFTLGATFAGLVCLEALSFLPFMGFVKWLFILIGFGATSKVFYSRLFARLNS